MRVISNKEKINITDDALFTIAKNSAGGMRDSISLLDQLSLLGVSKEITSEDVNAILGRISFDVLNKLSEKIILSSPNEAIEIINEIYSSGNEPLQILTNLSEYFKNLLIVKSCKEELLIELTGLNLPQLEELKKQKDKLETQQIVFLIERITYYIKEVKLATNQHLWLEVSIIDLSNMTENSKLIDLENRIRIIENGTHYNAVQNNSPVYTQTVTRPSPIPPDANTEVKTSIHSAKQNQSIENDNFSPPPMSKKSSGNDINTLWESLLSKISSAPAKALLKQMGTPVKLPKKKL